MKYKKPIKFGLLVLVAVLAAPISYAVVPANISGKIRFSNFDWTVTGDGTAGTPYTLVVDTTNISTFGLGDFAGETGAGTSFNPLELSPFTPGQQWWKTDNFEFSVSSATLEALDVPSKILELSGTGVITGGMMYNPTPGVWSFSGGDLEWSAATKAVPLPAAVWMFGTGLLGLAGVARKRRAS